MISGKKLEKLFFERFMPNKSFGYRQANEAEDLEEGTDFFCDGLRFDLTEDFDGKDHINEKFQEEIILPYGIIKLGLRTGNNTCCFVEPVVVLGIIVYSYDTAIKAVDCLSQCWEQISDKAFDLICNFEDYVASAA